jgi:hypothetical protein
MESGRVGSSPSTMPESREWADPAEMLESANGERNIHKEFMALFVCHVQHKVHIYKEYLPQCMSLVGTGTLPTPLSPLPPVPGGGVHTRLRVRGWGRPNSDDWRKCLALCLLCGVQYLLSRYYTCTVEI